ncbi:hypothetical protein Taro_007457 [Colocasia esculenta]|uniref:Uncharacterized protein n=1 Tax=Colocasia esculenta TaxID=4460 RepID=A0A843TV21_COLES|nr:hypothetical protein [Colocasia esculenta]
MECNFQLTCDWFSRAEFEKFVDDLILRKIEVQEVVVEVSKNKHRGLTKQTFVHGLDNGTIALLGDKMSIDAPTWRAMSATHKDDVWEYVQHLRGFFKQEFHCEIPTNTKRKHGQVNFTQSKEGMGRAGRPIEAGWGLDSKEGMERVREANRG